VISSLDGHSVSYAFLRPKNDRFEVAFFQRPIGYTVGKFTTKLYQHLLVSTHTDVITSPVCGLDRWFDNHYGFDTLKWADDATDYNYIDRVLARLIESESVFRLYHTPYEDESPEGKMWMEVYGFMDLYTMYVFDANGQTIQMFGVFRDSAPLQGQTLPIYNKQWCDVPCPGQREMGEFTESKMYVEDKEDVLYDIVTALNAKYDRNGLTVMPGTEGTERVFGVLEGEIVSQGEGGDVVVSEVESESDGKGKGNGPTVFIAEVVGIVAGTIACVIAMICLYRCVPIQSRYRDGEKRPLLNNQPNKP